MTLLQTAQKLAAFTSLATTTPAPAPKAEVAAPANNALHSQAQADRAAYQAQAVEPSVERTGKTNSAAEGYARLQEARTIVANLLKPDNKDMPEILAAKQAALKTLQASETNPALVDRVSQILGNPGLAKLLQDPSLADKKADLVALLAPQTSIEKAANIKLLVETALKEDSISAASVMRIFNELGGKPREIITLLNYGAEALTPGADPKISPFNSSLEAISEKVKAGNNPEVLQALRKLALRVGSAQ